MVVIWSNVCRHQSQFFSSKRNQRARFKLWLPFLSLSFSLFRSFEFFIYLTLLLLWVNFSLVLSFSLFCSFELFIRLILFIPWNLYFSHFHSKIHNILIFSCFSLFIFLSISLLLFTYLSITISHSHFLFISISLLIPLYLSVSTLFPFLFIYPSIHFSLTLSLSL